MTKITLSIVAAAIAASALFTSAAQACISCQYVPEVIAAGNKKAARKQPMYAARPTPKRIEKLPAAPKKIEVAKAPAPKKIEAAAAPATAKPIVTAAAEPAPREKPISTAALIDAGGSTGEPEEPAATESAPGCKKFFPAVGMTLTVPCE